MNGQSTINDCDYIGKRFFFFFRRRSSSSSKRFVSLVYFSIEQGVWSDFEEWSSCSVSCGEGFQYRQRECLSMEDKTRKIPHNHCIGKHMELRPCDVTTCPSKSKSL